MSRSRRPVRSAVLPAVFLALAVPAGLGGAVGGARAQEGVPDLSRTAVPGTDLFAPILPPEPPWSGPSRDLAVDPGDPWATPFEAGGMTSTPRYEETLAWLRRLAEASPRVKLVSLGMSGEGREIPLVVISAGGASTPEELARSGKPVLFVQACIHGGECDGKDAGMMLARDLTVRGTAGDLLDGASVLFVPILNVDGHERFTRYGRINQRGPEEAGWRTDARNLNLNRDYMKLDAPETRAVVAALDAWNPDLYVDVHVTDGVDVQYDVTFGYAGPQAWSPNAAAWLDAVFTPAVTHDLQAMGHVPGPLVFAVDDRDLSRGIRDWTPTPRFSHGYGPARHLPTVLVENHSLKPYDRRVLGTYVFLESALRVLGDQGKSLRRAAEQDRSLHRETVPLAFGEPEGKPRTRTLLAVRSRLRRSEVTGGVVAEWTGEPVTLTVPVRADTEPAATARRPRAYWIPAEWTEVRDRLAAHGVRMERIAEPREVAVTVTRFGPPRFADGPYEGRLRVTAAADTAVARTVRFPAGSVRVPTDQPLGDLAVLLLEPGSPDSFFQWGFFNSVLDRTEYAEEYVMEPMAARMLAEDPQLNRLFTEKLAADPDFARDPRARLDWFYRQTPYFDARWREYPVAREE